MSVSIESSGRDTPSPAAAQEDDDMFSLDFTQPSRLTVPPVAKPAVPARPATPPAPARPRLELSLAPRDDDPLPSPASAVVAPTAPVQALPAFPVVSLPTPVMQAACAYGAGDAAAARRILEAACADAAPGSELSETVWGLLFDVYRRTGERGLFDQLSLDYAQRFEKSPPAWSLAPKAAAATAGAQEARASVALSGHLSARNAPQFEQLLKVAATRSQLRLDLGKIQDADEGGCQLLLDTLRTLARTPCELVLGHIDHLSAVLAPKLVSGVARQRAIWLLQLELLQHQHQMEAFEALALDYAITFEESPPSWVAPAAHKNRASELAPASVDVLDLQEACLTLGGVLSDCPAGRFASLTTAQGEEKIIDVAELQRIDQVSAQRLVLQLAVCANAGERLRLRGAGPLVAAMLELAGCTQHATLERARY